MPRCEVCAREKRSANHTEAMKQMGREWCRAGGMVQQGHNEAECCRIGYERLRGHRDVLLKALRPFAVGAGSGVYHSLMRQGGMEEEANHTEAAAAAIALAETNP